MNPEIRVGVSEQSGGSMFRTHKQRMGCPNRDEMKGISLDWVAAGHLRQLQPALDMVLHEKPVDKHGFEVTYRSLVTFASAGDPFRSLLIL
jgi:hypothetical protein